MPFGYVLHLITSCRAKRVMFGALLKFVSRLGELGGDVRRVSVRRSRYAIRRCSGLNGSILYSVTS